MQRRTGELKDEREDAEMSLRASCLASPRRGNYVVWLDPSAIFATFPFRLKERQDKERRRELDNHIVLIPFV